MSDERNELPGDLAAIERELLESSVPRAPERLRSAVLDGVRSTLERDARATWIRYAVAAAAVLLLWLNLYEALGLRRPAFDFIGDVRADRSAVASAERAFARELREALPDISEEQALAHARLHRAGASLASATLRVSLMQGGAAVRIR